MAGWTKPAFARPTVNAAGKILRQAESATPDQLDWAHAILGNWRSSHSFPLNTFQMNLRRTAVRYDKNPLIAQRLKRTASIIQKLQRFPTMNLVQMQDIGGCRAVVKSVKDVGDLYVDYQERAFRHELVNQKNYIGRPKDTGYRSIHLVYRYNSDRSETYNGLLIEIQIRSQLQHAWATAVETVDTFLQYALKASQGPAPWMSFFAHVGSVFAEFEKTSPVPGTPNDPRILKSTVREMAKELRVLERLRTYGMALNLVADPDRFGESHYFLLRLLPASGSLSVIGYEKGELEIATQQYLQMEREAQKSGDAEVVLVAADSLSALRLAYPNYFLDTTAFVARLTAYLA